MKFKKKDRQDLTLKVKKEHKKKKRAKFVNDHRMTKLILTLALFAISSMLCVYTLNHFMDVYGAYRRQKADAQRLAVQSFSIHEAAHLAVAWTLPALAVPVSLPELEMPGDTCSWSEDHLGIGKGYEAKEYHFSVATAALAAPAPAPDLKMNAKGQLIQVLFL